jgi:glutathione-specific gamma-glutamylcyclotransferase
MMAHVSHAVFGYGSLVNAEARKATLRASPAELAGWTRQWMHAVETSKGNTCVLTVGRQPGATLLGVVMPVNQNELADFDRRETAYKRAQVKVRLSASGVVQPAWIYVGDAAHRQPATRECPIWLSYVDCVLAGYFELGGAAAVEGFITSTTGWDGPLRDDRAAPLYSRAVRLTSAQKQAIDEALARHGILERAFS